MTIDTVKQKNIVAKIYDNNFKTIYRFFYYKVLDQTIAEDLTSKTFLTFVELFDQGKDIEKPKNFLYGIAKNIFLKYLRAKYKNPVSLGKSIEDFATYVQEFLKKFDKGKTLEERAKPFIAKLPEKQKAVIELRLIKKYSLQEIAGEC